ncbi:MULTISPECIES: hypothetical protein [unclassified Fibrobacter]|uniref:hypothetical protein n=1 Tax=unclassified Fibrobacter TaxID=2634177 RepID=UPI0009140420|nr:MULTISPECIES: hypothetical protein [unclassified Fibrobacter]OWV05678.1 hypothetical protein B7993_07180 [Fibrobacter sp. UWH3]SHK13206.1 hypothetical protein SAMN05720765_1013 [Fibrobacter sp. UWH6]
MNILRYINALIHPFDTIASIIDSKNSELQKNISNIFEYTAYDLTKQSLSSKENGISTEKICDNEVIVSLTSYGKRIHDVYLAIESIMQGSVKPNKIILWLDEETLKKEKLPVSLQNQQNRGLEIEFCKDIKSYTKLIYALKKYPNANIITIDDDIIYKYDLVENLIRSHLKDTKCICANRIHQIKKLNNGKLDSYLNWKWNLGNDTTISSLNFFTGVGGVLYPPNSLHKEVFNEDVFLSICPTADDVWFNAMARLQGTPICKAFTHSNIGEDYLDKLSPLEAGLGHNNNNPQNCLNDIQIKAVFEKYSIYKLL